MSRNALIVALLLAVTLGGVALLLLTSQPTSPTAAQPSPLFDDLNPALVAELGVDDQQFARGPDGNWRHQPSNWPADNQRILAILRALASFQGAPSEAPPDAEAIPVVASSEGAREWRARVLRGSVAGNVRVATDDAVLAAESPLLRLVTARSPEEWLQTAAAPLLPANQASRLTIRHEELEQHVALARVAGVWRLIAPIEAPADDEAVNRALAGIAELRIERFLDDAAQATPPLPFTIEIEHDVPGVDEAGGPTRLVRTWSLGIGRPADAAARRRQARLAPPAADPRLAIIDGQPLARVALNAPYYIARNALQLPDPDLQSITIIPSDGEATTFTRTRGSWQQPNTPGEAPSSPAPARRIADLMSLLRDTPGVPRLTADPEALTAAIATDILIESTTSDRRLRLSVGRTETGRLIANLGDYQLIYDADAPAPEVLQLPVIAPATE